MKKSVKIVAISSLALALIFAVSYPFIKILLPLLEVSNLSLSYNQKCFDTIKLKGNINSKAKTFKDVFIKIDNNKMVKSDELELVDNGFFSTTFYASFSDNILDDYIKYSDVKSISKKIKIYQFIDTNGYIFNVNKTDTILLTYPLFFSIANFKIKKNDQKNKTFQIDYSTNLIDGLTEKEVSFSLLQNGSVVSSFSLLKDKIYQKNFSYSAKKGTEVQLSLNKIVCQTRSKEFHFYSDLTLKFQVN